MTLLVTDPANLTPSEIVATNVAEDDHAAWNISSTYALSDRVIDGQSVYESLQADNIGHDPAASPTWWQRVGATNRWRCFDTQSIASKTARAGGFYYELRPSRPPDTIHMLGFTAVSRVRITITAPDSSVLYDSGIVAVGRVVPDSSWWQWFFGKRAEVRQQSFTDLPRYAGAVVRVEVWGGDACALGVLIFGNRQQIGRTRIGLRLGIEDYSRRERNQWGDVTLVKRAYSRQIAATMMLSNKELDTVEQFLSNRRATPLMWEFAGRWQATRMLGYYRSWAVLIQYTEHSDVSIEIEGMTDQ